MNSQFIDLDYPIGPRPLSCPVPLTPSQVRIWNRSLMPDGRRLSLRMCASAVHIVGPLSLPLLQRSIEIVIRRHEALRTRIILKNGSPYQHIESGPGHVLSIVDLSDQPSHASREISRLAKEFIGTKIDLMIGALFEAKVWRLSDNEHVLVLLIDHMVSDGISNGIIAREVWECYRAGVLGQPVSLPQISVQFPDYAVWQAQTRLAWMEKHAEYWRQHLRGVGPTGIPADKSLSDRNPATETIKHVPFGDELTAALRAAARRERVPLSAFVLAAYAVILSECCRTEDILLMFASHARHRAALRPVVGFLANILYLRIQVNKEQTFGELLVQVKREIASALEHRDFDRVPDLLPECAETEVGFNWQSTHSRLGVLDHYVATECEYSMNRSVEFELNIDGKGSPMANQLRVKPFVIDTAGPSKHFIPVIFDTPSTLLMMISFDPNILAPDTIERFCRNLFVIAKEICHHPTPCIASLLGKIDVN